MRSRRWTKRLFRPLVVALIVISSRLIRTRRVRVVIVNENDEVLLVRGVIGRHDWELPGGGARQNEPLEKTALRELHEETGLTTPPDDLKLYGNVAFEGYDAAIYTAKTQKKNVIDGKRRGIEITEVKWFGIDRLPDVSPVTREIIRKIGAGA